MSGLLSEKLLSSSLNESAKHISMNQTASLNTLTNTLSDAGMRTDIIFTAAASAIILHKLPFVQVLSLATAGVTAVSVAAALLLTPPSIHTVNYAAALTNQNARIIADVKFIGGDGQVYLLGAGGARINGIGQGDNQYLLDVGQNGVYTLCAKGPTGQTVTQEIAIDFIDKDVPLLIGYTHDEAALTIELSDAHAGIDFDSIYALTKDGQRIRPLEVLPAENKVLFPIMEENYTLFVSDLVDNVARFAVSNVRK